MQKHTAKIAEVQRGILATSQNTEPYDVFAPSELSAWKDIVAVSAGSYHTVGLKADGTVVSVGPNILSECEVDGWKNIWIPENAFRP